MSELESVRNSLDWKVPELESVRNCSDWKVSEIAQIGKCHKLLRLEGVRIRNGKVLGVPMGTQCSKSF